MKQDAEDAAKKAKVEADSLLKKEKAQEESEKSEAAEKK